MFGLIGKMRAQPGMRDSLLEILTSSTGGMPGCLSYVIAKAEDDEDVIWITEVWDTEESHKASLSLPQVQQAISKARPLIAGFESHVRTAPIRGVGAAQVSAGLSSDPLILRLQTSISGATLEEH